MSVAPAAFAQPTPQGLALSGPWTARGIGAIERQLDAFAPAISELVVDGARITALDTAGAWVLQKLLRRLREQTGRDPRSLLFGRTPVLEGPGEAATNPSKP